MIWRLACFTLFSAGAALAEPATAPCEGYPGSIAALNTPVSESSRSFANGAVQIFILGAGEPACCGTWIGVLQPGEAMFPECTLVFADRDRTGWADVEFAETGARYDPGIGLGVPLVVSTMNANGHVTRKPLVLVINQAKRSVEPY